MSTYAISHYGRPTLYGPDRPTTVNPGGPPLPLINSAYLIDPFVAAAIDYTTILLTWNQPDVTTSTPMSEFRLLSNRYGFPVDENDGLIMFDQTTMPPSSWVDQNVIPGTMHYYAFYIYGEDTAGTPMWIRAGFTACLMPTSYNSGANLLGLLPEYNQDLNDQELTASNTTQSFVTAPVVPASSFFINSPYPFPVQVSLTGGSVTDVVVDGIDLGVASQFWIAGNGQVTLTYEVGNPPTWTWANIPADGVNPYLRSFLDVAGWALDYAQTQYDFQFNTLNNPMAMSLDQLVQLAGEIGMPFTSEMPAYYMRKAVANWSTVMRQRGSVAGIEENIELLTGYGADIQVSRNIMLENDQSNPDDPNWTPWSASTPWHLGERVTYPTYNPWSDSLTYISGNAVNYNGVFYQFSGSSTTEVPPVINGTLQTGWAIIGGPYVYQCATAVTSLPGTAPSGTAGSNATWTFVYDVDDWFPAWATATSYTAGTRVAFQVAGLWYDFLCLQNNTSSSSNVPTPGVTNAFWEPVFERLMLNQTNLWQGGSVSTWEPVIPAALSTQPANETLINGIGVPNPANFTNDYTSNTFRLYNRSGSVQTQWLRSVIRQTSDFTNTTLNVNGVPDPQAVIEHGIPVPSTSSMTEWNPDVRYATGTVVSWATLPYQALRASTGMQPPTVGVPINQNSNFTASIVPWTGVTGATVTLDSTHAYNGTTAMKITFAGGHSVSQANSENVPVLPNGTYTGTAWVYASATWASVSVYVNWFDAWGEALSSAVSGGSIAATTWTKISVNGTAPLGAASGTLSIVVAGTPTTALILWADLCSLTCAATPEWQPLGPNNGIPLMISAEASQSLSTSAAETFAITPFVEWYDNWGNFISRVFARTPTAGTPGVPSSYVYDGFDTGPGTFLQGRATDVGSQTWTTATGSYSIDGDGNVYPTIAGSAALATVTVPSSATQAVTFARLPQASQDSALIFWYQSSTKYWHAGMAGLWYNSSGTWTEAAAYSTACGVNDRVYVITNQSGSTITMPNGTGTLASPGVCVFRNVISTSGQIAKVAGSPPFGTTIPSAMVPSGSTAQGGIASETV